MEIDGVTIYRLFGSKPTTSVLLTPCHDEFRGSRSDCVRQVALETTTVEKRTTVKSIGSLVVMVKNSRPATHRRPTIQKTLMHVKSIEPKVLTFAWCGSSEKGFQLRCHPHHSTEA
ncbi:hypothetical protein TNCV_5010891 [Trichonephila clavipes]|nr:hypothetical protein TNCV_5010891 [Trichonephila clavipes]